MSSVRLFNPDDLPRASGFSHAAAAPGELVWISGQTSCDASGAVLHEGDMAGQFAEALRNMGRALRAAGSDPSAVVKITYFVTDIPAYKEAAPQLGAPYRELFGRHYPAATLVEVSGLMAPGTLVEIECVAVVVGRDDS